MRTLDDLGATIERQLDNVEMRLGEHGIGSFVLGVVLAVSVIVGGIAVFAIVLMVLVQFFA